MSTIPSSLLLAGVHVGQSLPELSHEVSATTVVLGAMASRDWRPMHHDKDFAVNRNGVQDIFLNTPTQAAWIERYLSDWSGPKGRIGRLRFAMKSPLFPGDTMRIGGTVSAVSEPANGFGWVTVQLRIHVGSRLATDCEARVAIALGDNDNPWQCGAGAWQP